MEPGADYRPGTIAATEPLLRGLARKTRLTRLEPSSRRHLPHHATTEMSVPAAGRVRACRLAVLQQSPLSYNLLSS